MAARRVRKKRALRLAVRYRLTLGEARLVLATAGRDAAHAERLASHLAAKLNG